MSYLTSMERAKSELMRALRDADGAASPAFVKKLEKIICALEALQHAAGKARGAT